MLPMFEVNGQVKISVHCLGSLLILHVYSLEKFYSLWSYLAVTLIFVLLCYLLFHFVLFLLHFLFLYRNESFPAIFKLFKLKLRGRDFRQSARLSTFSDVNQAATEESQFRLRDGCHYVLGCFPKVEIVHKVVHWQKRKQYRDTFKPPLLASSSLAM